jgi:predicted nuclease of predicted toxin-antitoxin system
MLLLDQNLSYRLLKILEPHFPNTQHVGSCGLPVPAADNEIWNYARQNGLIVLTFDEDFNDLLSLRGAPPKVIWLRTGNLSTAKLSERLLAIKEEIARFAADPVHDLLVVYQL